VKSYNILLPKFKDYRISKC